MKPEFTPSIVKVNEERFKKPFVFRINLPSNGVLYDGKMPAGEVYISPMTASEEALLASNKADKVSVVDLLCKRCLVECPISYDDLLVGDTFYLLLCIRNVSYGGSYRFNLTCSNCGTSFARACMVPDDLKVVALSEEDANESYSVKLPMSGDTVSFRLLRNKDEEAIRRYTKNKYQRSAEDTDPSYCFRLATHIEEINGKKLDILHRLSYVESMIASDVSALKQAIQDRDFGVDLMLSGNCPACGFPFEEILPFDRNFFRSVSA